MARTFARASAQRVTLDSLQSSVDRSVGTIALWANITDTTNINTISAFRVDGNNEFGIAEFNGNFGLTLRAQYNAGGVNKTVSRASISGTGLHHLAITWDKGADEFKFYYDGTQQGATQTGLGVFSAAAINNFYLAASNSAGEELSGDISEYSYHSIALSVDDIGALAKGFTALSVRPDKLAIYMPLLGNDSPEPNRRGGSGTLANSPTKGAHPRVYMQARTAIVSKAGSVSGATGTAIETDAALSLAPVQIRVTGAALETDAAIILSSSRPAGLAAETDSALALSAGSANAVGRADETDTAVALAGVAIKATGLAAGTDAAVSLGAVAIRAVGLAASGQTSLPLGSARPAAPAPENETALGLSPVAIRQCGTALEGGAALALLAVHLRLVGLSSEADTAFGLSSAGTGVGVSLETDIALSLVASASVSRMTGSRPTSGASRLRQNLSTGSRPAAVSRG